MVTFCSPFLGPFKARTFAIPPPRDPEHQLQSTEHSETVTGTAQPIGLSPRAEPRGKETTHLTLWGSVLLCSIPFILGNTVWFPMPLNVFVCFFIYLNTFII